MILAREFLELLEKDWNNPEIRARFEKWQEEQKKEIKS